MSNELLLWGSFIVPWLTLFFMPKQDIKRYMPVGLLTAVLSALIIDIGIAFGLWSTSQTVFPFSLLPPIIYGLPVFAMWVFKLTYGRFWLYAVTNAVLDLAFDYLILPWLASRGMFDYNLSIIDFIITTTHAWLLYGYQMWQETIFAYSPSTTRYASSLRPAAAKPLPPEEDSLDKD
ncbi:hypothetical protein [Anaerospora hongkongensis]|uniref:hypothetical protein n=1 Tax=Anaerospora hongkongensis TaxID=244830 RepID=UPI00289F1701|nr:hypothetical protein [Anaerospora hongkongensis]